MIRKTSPCRHPQIIEGLVFLPDRILSMDFCNLKQKILHHQNEDHAVCHLHVSLLYSLLQFKLFCLFFLQRDKWTKEDAYEALSIIHLIFCKMIKNCYHCILHQLVNQVFQDYWKCWLCCKQIVNLVAFLGIPLQLLCSKLQVEEMFFHRCHRHLDWKQNK